jgi:tRNA U55 pseudouridine synthase TruB
MDEALSDFPAVLLSESDTTRVRHGNPVSCPADLLNRGFDRVRLHGSTGTLLAVARGDAGVLKPETVFAHE